MSKYELIWRGKEGKQSLEFSREEDDKLSIIELVISFFNCETGVLISIPNRWDSLTIVKREKETANFTEEQIHEWLTQKRRAQVGVGVGSKEETA